MAFTATVVLAVGSAAASAASSLGPGVHIDPGSPAAKQYAIPLAQARGGGSGGQLFGSGITRAPSAGASAAASGATSPSTPARRQRSDLRPPRRLSAHPSSRLNDNAAAAPAEQHSGPSGARRAGIAWMLGVAALVLALGGLGGALLARHGRRASARTS